jgi:hypothetical protein
VPILNPKSTIFSPLVPVLSIQEIEEKNSKKVFLGACNGPKKNFQKFAGSIWYMVLLPK